MKRKFNLQIISLMVLCSLSFIAFIQSAQAQLPSKRQIQQARKLADEGDKLYKQRNYKLAIDRYDKALALVPNYPHASYFKGLSHYNVEEFEPALTALNKAFDQGYNRKDIYNVRWFIYYRNKDYDNAMADIQEIIKVQPNNGPLLITLGDIYSGKNMDNEAVENYQKAALLLPNNADLQYSIAYSYARMGNTTQQGVYALNAIQKGTRFYGDAWYLVGNAFQVEKKFPEAAEAFEKAITAKPELSDAYTNLAQIYQNSNRLNDSINILKKGAEANPNNGDIFIDLTWFLSLADRHVEAVGAGKKAIALAPGKQMGYTNLCRAYLDLRQFELALQACNGALKITPDDGETNFYIGRVYRLQEKLELAKSYYNKAVTGLIETTKNNPDVADGHYLLGNAYLALEKKEEAIAAYKRCLEISPKFTKVIFNIGYAYFLLGDKTNARSYYNDLLKLDPELAASLLKIINGK